MAARIYSQFPERKLPEQSPPATAGAGPAGRVVVKQAYTHMNLPGKASNGFAEAKRGTPEVCNYAAYVGLSKGGKHPGFKTVAKGIAAREGVSQDRANAMLAAGTRRAGKAARKANPRLNRVKGY